MMKQSDYEVAQTGPTAGLDSKKTKDDHRRRNVLIALVLLILLTLLGWLILPSAKVTIIPVSQAMSNAYTLQVPARTLSVTTPAQSQTVNATGQGETGGAVAQGTLTFYNFALHWQKVPAGTIFTSKGGVQVITLQDTYIPPDPGYPGVKTAHAHAVQVGSSGNIAAFAISGPVSGLKRVIVQNQIAFAGGQDPERFAVVLQSDINRATEALRNVLTPIAVDLYARQIGPNEKPVTPAHLTLTAPANHTPGDKATQVTVTGTMAASGEVYDELAAKAQAVNLLKQEAAKKLGPDYLPVGDVTGQILQAPVVDKQGMVELSVQAQGTWAYHLSDSRKQQLAQSIAGKNVDEARTLLLLQPGIRDVRIDLHSFVGNTLPLLPSRIEF